MEGKVLITRILKRYNP